MRLITTANQAHFPFHSVVIFCSFLVTRLLAQDPHALQTIQGDDILHHARFLASEELRGRETFTHENRIAGRYIANEFRRAGLKPIDSSHTFFQNIPSPFSLVESPGVLEIDGNVLFEGKDFRVAAVGSNAIDAEAVFVGYGISVKEHDSYSGVDVNNKIVVVFEGNYPGKSGSMPSLPQLLAANAIEHGAAGMIFIRGTSPNRRKFEIPSDLSLAELRFFFEAGKKSGIIQWTSDTSEKWFRFPFVYVEKDIAKLLLRPAGKEIAAIKAEIDKLGKPQSFPLHTRVKMQTTLTRNVRTARNVVGLVEGSDPALRNEVVIVGAHYDHIGQDGTTGYLLLGADDNASGTAALLEIARAFALADQKPKRSVLFIAFTGEERSVLGSQYYVDHPLIPLSETRAMVCLDMIGRNDPDSIGLATEGIPEPLKSSLCDGSREFGLTLQNIDGHLGSSDQVTFMLKETPVVFLHDGGGGFQHALGDTWDRLSPTKMEKVARYAFSLIHKLADRP